MNPLWRATTEVLQPGSVVRVRLLLAEKPVPYSAVLEGWRGDAGFRRFLTRVLAGAPFRAFRWETPPVTAATVDREFEMVLLGAPKRDRTPDPTAFTTQLGTARPDETVAAFPNLGRDAVLVVPCPVGPTAAYGHLAAFLRDGPEAQQHELWQRVGAAMAETLGERPVWLSTAGAGVPWLHVRLDSRPKYYGFAAYRERY